VALTKYLIGQVFESPEERFAALREFFPNAKQEDWTVEVAGQRVQIIKKDPTHGGILEFGTELVIAVDHSIVAILGASPGAAMGADDIVPVDTGALKMWMARLCPTYKPNTCLISNGLSTLAFSLPGAIAAKLACPERNVLAVMADGGFLMNSQEIETALREQIPFVVLIRVDGNYGLIKWKMELELGRSSHIAFTNPDFVKYAESSGAKGYLIGATDELLPTLRTALAGNTVSIIACPVNYSENIKLTDKLGEFDGIVDPVKMVEPGVATGR
jgi:thiamine pyrophosphate-dependent acetolactate synthase large subunit-like protein